APSEYPEQVEGAFRMGTGGWVSLSLSSAAGLALAVAARQRFQRRARAKEAYWREKQEFLDSRPSADPEQEDWSGRMLDGRFLLESRIASGGFAAVYRAIDEVNGGEPAAVKVLHPVRDHVEWRRRRFVEEVEALKRMDDPGIVR